MVINNLHPADIFESQLIDAVKDMSMSQMFHKADQIRVTSFIGRNKGCGFLLLQ